MDNMDRFSITKNGNPLDESLYTIDIENREFSSREDDLVLDFNGWIEFTFKTGDGCTFSTGGGCTFKTGYSCNFYTGSGCTFITENNCTFNTGESCTFNTSSYCTFNTESSCTFDTSGLCTFLICNVDTCKFRKYDGLSIILDRADSKAYKLTKEFVQLQKVKNG